MHKGTSLGSSRGDQTRFEFPNVFIHPTVLNGDFDSIPTTVTPTGNHPGKSDSELKLVNILMGDLVLRLTKPKATSPPLDSIILSWVPRSETKKIPLSKAMFNEKTQEERPRSCSKPKDMAPSSQLRLTSSTASLIGVSGPSGSLKARELPPKESKPKEGALHTSHRRGPSFMNALKRPLSGFPFITPPGQAALTQSSPKEKQRTQEEIEIEIISNGFSISFRDIFGLHKGMNSGQYGGKIWIVKNSQEHTVLPPLYFLEKHTFTSFLHTLQERMECKNDPSSSNMMRFSVLEDKFLISKSFFGLQGFSFQGRESTKKESPMTADEYMKLFDAEGRIGPKSREFFSRKAYYNGFEGSIRTEAWKFLLGFYPFDSTLQDRADIFVQRQHDYSILKTEWITAQEQEQQKDQKFTTDKYQIEKDVKRTDREDPCFDSDAGVKKLYDVLVTYDYFNKDINYVQGMNFLCSTIMKVMEGDEVFTFWCFKNVMDRCSASFCNDQFGMKTQLHALSDILKIVDPELYAHLEKACATEMFICYRWLLVLFRMEFTMDTTITIWESLFSGYLATSRPELFFSLAMIVHVRSKLISRPYTFDELLALFNTYDTKNQIPCTTLITLAEKLYKKFVQAKPNSDLLSYVLGPRGAKATSNTGKTQTTSSLQMSN